MDENVRNASNDGGYIKSLFSLLVFAVSYLIANDDKNTGKISLQILLRKD